MPDELFEKSIETLELPKVLALLAAEAATDAQEADQDAEPPCEG